MLRRLIQRVRRTDTGSLPGGQERVNLVNHPGGAGTAEGKAPAPLGIQTQTFAMPWSVNRVEGIFKRLSHRPNQQTLMEARYARHCLSSFWLTAPVDQLETLYSGDIGALQMQILDSMLPAQRLSVDERQWRDNLQQKLDGAEDLPEQLNLLLAVMPYHLPLNLRVKNPISKLPRWLLRDYARFCEPALEPLLSQPVALLKRAGKIIEIPLMEGGDAADLATESLQPLALDPLPAIAEYRAEEALELLDRDEFRQRMTGLINLYQIDPRDLEIQSELARLRRQLAQLWIDLSAESLESLFYSSIGDLYRQLLASSFCRAMPSEEDLALRKELAKLASDLSRPGAVNMLLAAMLFYPPEKIEIEGHEAELPGWLLADLQQRRASAGL